MILRYITQKIWLLYHVFFIIWEIDRLDHLLQIVQVLKLIPILYTKAKILKAWIQVFFEKFIFRKKSEFIDYITHVFCITYTIFLLDQLLTIANYFKKQKSGVIAEKVFKNHLLVEKIARNLDRHQFLRFREVNKSLNNSCLGVIRKDHRTMKIEFLQHHHEFLAGNSGRIIVHVNLIPVKLSKFDFYIRFLSKVASLQIERIEVFDFSKLISNPANRHLAQKFHQDLHSELIGNSNNLKSLIGLADELGYCPECIKISKTCLEYGPINQFWMLTKKNGRHFERIVVTDVFLDLCANSLVSDSRSRENCYKLLEDRFAKPNISCRTLHLHIYERRDTDRTGEIQDHTPIPWEVLEMALRKWNVESIKIKFIFNEKDMPFIESWSRSNYFTGIRFNDPLLAPELSRKFSHVHVDLSRSEECGQDLKLQNYTPRGYKYTIANIRRIFHPDQISINFSHWLNVEPLNLQEVLENFLKISRFGFHQNLTIDVKLYIQIEENFKISGGFSALGSLSPEYRKVMDMIIQIKTEKWIGQRFRYVDFEKNFTLNADLFVEEENLKKVMWEEHQAATEFMGMFQLDVFE